MHAIAQATEHKTFRKPDEVRNFPNGKAEILRVGEAEIGRLTFEPGWRWSNDVKPIAKTSSCQAPHFQYHVAGKLAIKMDDGTEFIAGPGDITSLPSGHDAWVVGDEPVDEGAVALGVGAGVTLLPRLSVPTEARTGQLTLRDFASPAPHRTLALKHRPALAGEHEVKTRTGTVTVKPAFQVLRERLDSAWTPEQASRVCGTNPETIRRLARQIASAKAASGIAGASISKYYHGDLMMRAQILVFALTGQMGRKHTVAYGLYRCHIYLAPFLAEDTGFKPSVPFEEGIKETITWCRQNLR